LHSLFDRTTPSARASRKAVRQRRPELGTLELRALASREVKEGAPALTALTGPVSSTITRLRRAARSAAPACSPTTSKRCCTSGGRDVTSRTEDKRSLSTKADALLGPVEAAAPAQAGES
jgi:hypothetical protein